MKRILYIAKNELYSLFYSPIAWILMIFFLVLTSAEYINALDNYVGVSDRGGPMLAYLKNLTSKILANPGYGYFGSVISNLYLFFPLITMGLISREINSGTIKLLHSSPIKIREIVLGKYLAILCFTLCLLLLVCLAVISFSLSVVNPDYGHIIASLFGLFLVLATFAAIGLFISSVTSYQIVAAIITFGVFAFLSKVGDLWQDIDLVRNITFYMNIGGKAGRFISGLMNLRDFAYFTILIVSFLMFTIIKIKSGTQSISPVKLMMRYVSVILVAFVVGYITNKPAVNVYYDATREKLYTITPPTQALLAKLDDKLEITFYANLFLNYIFVRPATELSTIADVWERYIRFKPDIDINFKYYYNTDTSDYRVKTNPGKTLEQIAKEEVRSYRTSLDRFMGPAEVNKYVNTEVEEFRHFFVLRYKGKEVVLRTFDDPEFWPAENEIAAALSKLISASRPKIGFLSDNIERGPYTERTRNYRLLSSHLANRYALINQGFDFDTISLHNKEVPADITVLAIADPRTQLVPESIEKINRYIDAGGDLFMVTEPDRKEVTKPIFDKLGLSAHNGMLVQPNVNFSSDIIFTYMTDSAINLSPQFKRTLTQFGKYGGDSVFIVAMAGASALDYQEKDGFRIHPLLYTDKKLSWNRMAPISNDSLQLRVSRTSGDESGKFITAVRMNRSIKGKDQRIIVAADADYLTKPQFTEEGPTRFNYMYGFWCFSYFTDGKYPANTLRPEGLDNAMKIRAENIPFQKMMFYWIIPAIIGIACSVILIRRKRK